MITANFEKLTMEELDSYRGIHFTYIPSDKFKTNCVDIFFVNPLKEKQAAMNALWPSILKRGCRAYKTQTEIALRLEELYGSNLSTGILKKGENQIMHFHMNQVSDSYTSNDTNLFHDTFTLLFDILNDPMVSDGCFLNDYFIQEKKNLIDRINSRVNDKMQYSFERCLEEMCKDEPFGIYELGSASNVESIDGRELFTHYRNSLKNSPIYVYLSGDLKDSDKQLVMDAFKTLDREEIKEIKDTEIKVKPDRVKQIQEKMDVKQGKLCLGFRTQVEPGSEDYYPLVVYNGILGGGIHSKLFQNVREKESLAYYSFSRLEKFKGLMIVSSGIEIENKQKTEDIIMQQLEEIKKGNITDYEMDATKKTFASGLEAMQDSQMAIVDFFFSHHMSDIPEDFESLRKKIDSVNKDDVIRVSKNILADTVYFLTDQNGDGK